MPIIYGGENLPWQLFPSPSILSANAVFLAVYAVLFLLAVFRLRTAPALGWLILFILLQIVVFALRVHEVRHDSVSRGLHRTMEAITALSFPALLETLVICTAEHFATADELHYGRLRRHSFFHHLLSLILAAVCVVAIYYGANLDEKRLDDTDRAYIVLLFVFLGLLLAHLLFRGPFLRYGTTVFLLLLAALCLIPVIYLELRYDSVTTWTSTEDAFYVLWCLPQTLVTCALLAFPLYVWYPDYRSAWIY